MLNVFLSVVMFAQALKILDSVATQRISSILYLFSYFWSDSDSNTDNVNHVG